MEVMDSLCAEKDGPIQAMAARMVSSKIIVVAKYVAMMTGHV